MSHKKAEGRSAGQRSRPSECLSRQIDHSEVAHPRSPANALIAVLDSQGFVVSVLAGRSAARTFLREGQA